MSIKQWVVMGLFLASGLAEAASPIVKGVFVDATTGAYLKGPVYVSKQGNDGNGGTSWDDAKLTIQAGVEAAIALGAGTTVLVGPGTYSDVSPTASADGQSTPTVVNLHSVKLYLKSSEGKEKTIILGQYGDQSNGCGTGARRCVYSAVAGNVVDGFTLKNGATVVTTFGNDSKCCGGAICAASDGGIDNSKGYTSSAQVWILYSDIVDCRAGRGAAFGRGVVSIGCHVTGCTAVDATCTLAYRSYNHYNDVYEGNGAGSGGLLSHASGCAALNCTFIGNNSDTAYGATASERCWVFNCALIANRYEAAAATRCVVSNCVTTFGETLYATTPGCVGGVSKYQVYSPVAGDFQPVAGSALIGAGSKDAIADWGAKWVPSDYIALDFYGNPRPYGAGDSVDVGAVQSSANPPAFGCGRVCLDNTCTAATFGGRTYRAKTATYGTSWLGLAAHPLAQIRFTCDRAAGEAVYAYEVIGYDSAMTQKFSVNMYPDSRTDEGVYINPPNGDIPTYSVAAKKATDIKWADPTRDDYSGADGSEAKPYETLQEAVNAVKANGVVYAKPGVYDKGVTMAPIDVANDTQDTNSTPNRVYINKAIRLASTGGAAVTTIAGAHDDSATGAYDGCGPQAVRCVLAVQYQKCAVQGFTFMDGATDGDLVHRGRWDKNAQGEPRFNSSDNMQRGNFGGGGFRASNWSTGYENGVVTDSIFTNCTAYWGGAIYGGLAQRCQFVGNTAVSNDPGAVSAPVGVAVNAVLLGCLVRDNFVAKGSVVTVSHARFTTLYRQSYNGADYLSHIGEDTTPKADTACVDPAHGDFRLRSTTGLLNKAAPKKESQFVRYSTSDLYGRPVLFYDQDNCAAGAVQDAAIIFVVGDGVTSDRPGGVLNPGESVTLTATGLRKVVGYQVGGTLANPVVTNTSDRVFTFTAPPVSGKVYKDYDVLRLNAVYAAVQDWYVDAENGDDAHDGWTPATAKRTLVASMQGAVVAGDTVLAAPGDYDEGVATNTANTYFSFRSDGTRHASRVIIPQGVTLKSLEGPSVTRIWGAWGGANRSQGLNAVRGVYMFGNTRLEGFTVTHGAGSGHSSGGTWDDNMGGNVYGCVGNSATPSRVVNCILVEGIARSGGAAAGCVLENCLIYNNDANSDGIVYGTRMYNCAMHSNGRSQVRSHCGVYSCSIRAGTTNGDPDLTPAGTSPIENSIIWIANSTTASSLKYAKNTLFHLTGGSKPLTVNEATCQNIITCAVDSVVTDVFVSEVDLHLKAGSPAIDAGDKALYAAALPDSDRDLEGGQRIYNGALDIGCYEYDWRPRYRTDLRHGRVEVREASPSVTENAAGKVELVDGSRFVIRWPGKGRPYIAEFAIAGEGTLSVTENDKTPVAYTAASADKTYVVLSPTADTELTFAYNGAGAATLLQCRSNEATTIIFR